MLFSRRVELTAFKMNLPNCSFHELLEWSGTRPTRTTRQLAVSMLNALKQSLAYDFGERRTFDSFFGALDWYDIKVLVDAIDDSELPYDRKLELMEMLHALCDERNFVEGHPEDAGK